MEKISVIIPIYRVEKYIEKCARSLFEQTYENLEYIFINDCTDDNSIEILNKILLEYKQRINQVKIINITTNKGLANTRKVGIEFSTGNFVIYCDSDDWVEANMYEDMYNQMKKYNYDLLFCDYYIENSKESVIYNKMIKNTSFESVFKRLLTSDDLNPIWSVMAKKELFKEIDFPTGDMSEDKCIVIQLTFYSQKIGYIATPLYHYRLSENSIIRSRSIKKDIQSYFQYYENREIIRRFAEQKDLYNKFKTEFDYFLFIIREHLYIFFYDKTYVEAFNNTYAISLKDIILNPYIKTSNLIKYILAKLHLVSYFVGIKVKYKQRS